MAKKEKIGFNIQMGMDGIGHNKLAESWTVPGQLYRPGPGEPQARNF